LPLGVLTGSDDPSRVRPTHSTIPAGIPLGTPLIDTCVIGGYKQEAAASSAAVTTVVHINIARSRRFMDTSSTAASYIPRRS
jgi:hypothetical protein